MAVAKLEYEVTVASVISGAICLNLSAHSSLFFLGIPSDTGSIICTHSGALGAMAASSDHFGPSNDFTKPSVVLRMLSASAEDIMLPV